MRVGLVLRVGFVLSAALECFLMNFLLDRDLHDAGLRDLDRSRSWSSLSYLNCRIIVLSLGGW